MPELRKDPLGGRWVVLSPERLRRPIHFQSSFTLTDSIDDHQNPFLPGNEAQTPPEVFAIRSSGSQANQPGWRVRVVPNRFPALRVEGELDKEGVGFYDRMNGVGAHEVIIETPDPIMALELQPTSGIVEVLQAYRTRMQDLSRDQRIQYILIFKNVGPFAGASLAHPHSQLIGLPVIPVVMKHKLEAARSYFEQKDRNLFEDIVRNEQQSGVRMVYENGDFCAFCPFASRMAFETWIVPRKQSAYFSSISDAQLAPLADALKQVLLAHRGGLDTPNYNLVLHSAPFQRPRMHISPTMELEFRWHIEILPRLTGVAGFEFGTGFFINPVSPEEAAKSLRKVIGYA